jgi:hypothetical protein
MGTRMLTAVTVVFYVLGWLSGAAWRAGGWVVDTIATGFEEGRHGRPEEASG